jgi:hypothetical protein
MKKFLFGFLLSFMVAVVISLAAVPEFVPYQGFLTKNGAKVNDPSMAMTFKLYSSATGATVLPNGTFNENVAVTDGIYAVHFPSSIFAANDTVFVETVIDGNALKPRMAITSVPYAVHADILTGKLDPGYILFGTATAGKVWKMGADGTPGWY